MISHVHRYVIGCLVPARFIGHIIVDSLAVYFQSFKPNVTNFAFFVIASNNRHIGLLAIVTDVAERHVFHRTTRSRAIFLIIAHLHL